MIDYKNFIGASISSLIEDVSAMRVQHFREYPYLYDGEGNSEYERQYLDELSRNKHAMITAAYRDNELIGVATGLPLASGADILAELAPMFAERGYNPATFYYLSEVIVAPAHRGCGIATRLYRQLEAQAVRWGYEQGCLATVVRDVDDPRAPPGYRHPAPLWSKFGYARTDMMFAYGWKTFSRNGTSTDAMNNMELWIKKNFDKE